MAERGLVTRFGYTADDIPLLEVSIAGYLYDEKLLSECSLLITILCYISLWESLSQLTVVDVDV